MKNFFKKIEEDQRGEMSFGTQILIFLVILFAIWVLLGGDKKDIDDTRIFIPINERQ